jgi:hypothetical protein
VICLFGAAVWGDSPSPELEARIIWAARLYREGRASLLFLSGGPTGSNLSESDIRGLSLSSRGSLAAPWYSTTQVPPRLAR